MSVASAVRTLDSVCDEAIESRAPVVIERDGYPDVVVVRADEWRSLQETAYLMSSPANARRLLSALEMSHRNEGDSCSVDELRRELDLASNS